jgi:protein-disulfide isomerase
VSELTSAPPPPPAGDDHVRGEGPEAILYLDLGCPHCAAAWRRVSGLPLRLCFRHFPVGRKHRRAPALHAAAEAAALQSEAAFWGIVDATYADHGRQDDPHLWERARSLGLDLERFDRDRRSPAVAARVRRDFESGIRAGVVATPTAFAAGRRIGGDGVSDALATMARDSKVTNEAGPRTEGSSKGQANT